MHWAINLREHADPAIPEDNARHFRCFSALASHDVALAVTMKDVKGYANLITKLNNQRDEIKTKALNAARSAREHTFEATFQRRIAQCMQILQQ